MRKILTLLALTTIVNYSHAQTKVSIDSVAKHIGESVEVCSKVFGVKSLEKVTFINLGAAYPNSPLTVVIFAKDLPNFKGSPATLYADKKICVTGLLKDYKGKAEIIVTKPEEITLE